MDIEQLLLLIRSERKKWGLLEDALTTAVLLRHLDGVDDAGLAVQLELVETAVSCTLAGDKAGLNAAAADGVRKTTDMFGLEDIQ